MESLPPPVPVNYLARSKSKERIKTCELCPKDALLSGSSLAKRFYCCNEHYQQDWCGNLCDVHELLAVVNRPVTFQFPEAKRLMQKEKNQTIWKQILDISLENAKKWLSQREYEFAFAALSQVEFITTQKLEVEPETEVTVQLLLAETYLGLKRTPSMEESLERARWIISKNDQLKNATILKAKFYRLFGATQVALNQPQVALEQFSEHVYFYSCAYNTKHILVAPVYLDMALIFFQLEQQQTGLKFLSFFTNIMNNSLQILLNKKKLAETEFDKMEQSRFTTCLESSIQCTRNYLGDQSLELGQALLANGKWCLCNKQTEQAINFISKANNIFQLVGDKDIKKSTKELLEQVQSS